MNMDTRQRRAFVKFVTASVCMPVETNPIIVHPQVLYSFNFVYLRDFLDQVLDPIGCRDPVGQIE